MDRATLRLAALLFLVLALLGPAAHVMEIPGKLRLDATEWLAVQQNLYAAFPVIGAVGYIGAPLACLGFAVVARRPHERGAAVAAAALVIVAFAGWWMLVAPVNGWIAGATPETLQPQWTAWRERWESGHAIAAALVSVALVVLLSATLREVHPSSATRMAAARAAGQA
jgi:hypothetical protein